MAEPLDPAAPPAVPPPPDPGAGTPTGSPPGAPAPGAAEDLSAKLAKLETDLASERARRTAVEETINALRPAPAAQPGRRATIPPPTREQVERLSDATGYTREQIAEYWPAMTAFFAEIAAPVLAGLDGMADQVDLAVTRQEVPDYGTVAEQADRVRKESVARGQFITRKQAVALVKAQRAEDPAWIDQQIADRQRVNAEREASASAAVMAGGGGTGGAAHAGSRGMPSKEDFAKLPVDQQAKLLAGVAI